MIIDESDGEIDCMRRALALGYRGTSHKNCKGVIKGIANRCLIEWYRRNRSDDGPWLMSGEDLANVGPVALLNDLAVMAVLWVTALPAYFGATDGVTANGDPIGSLWYTVLCFIIAGLSAAAALTVSAPKPVEQPATV